MNKIFFKSVWAVLAGFIFIGITHTGMDAILEGLGVLPRGNLFVGTGLILIVIAYRVIFSFIGCYITAFLAPRNAMAHTIVLGVVGLTLSTVGALANAKMHLGPSWYAWVLVAVSLPIAWIAGRVYLGKATA